MKQKDNKFLILLYPDTKDYVFVDILSKLTLLSEKYAFIYHDEDYKEDGTKDKTHVHFYLKTSSQRSIKALSEELLIDKRWIQYASSEKSSIRYLVHFDNPQKHQYDLEKVFTSFDIKKYFLTDTEFYDDWALIVNSIDDLELRTYKQVVLWGLATHSPSINKLIANKAFAIKLLL